MKTFLQGLSTRLEDLHGKATQYKGYQKNFKVSTLSVLPLWSSSIFLITSHSRQYWSAKTDLCTEDVYVRTYLMQGVGCAIWSSYNESETKREISVINLIIRKYIYNK